MARKALAIIALVAPLYAGAFGHIFNGSSFGKVIKESASKPAVAPMLIAGGIIGGVTAVVTTTDLVTWTSRTIEDAAGARLVITPVGNSSLLGIAAAGVGGKVYQSTDGVTWTKIATFPGDSFVRRVEYNAATSLYTAIGGKIPGGSQALLYTSPDGITWTDRSPAVAGQFFGLGVSSAGRKAVTVGADTLSPFTTRSYSTGDGTTWVADTPAGPLTNPDTGFWPGVALASDGTTWNAAQNLTGTRLATDGAGALTWTAAGGSSIPNVLQMRNVSSQTMLVTTGTDNAWSSNDNGGSWTNGVIPAGTWEDVAYFPEATKYVVVSSAGASTCVTATNYGRVGGAAEWATSPLPAGAYYSIVRFAP